VPRAEFKSLFAISNCPLLEYLMKKALALLLDVGNFCATFKIFSWFSFEVEVLHIFSKLEINDFLLKVCSSVKVSINL